MGAVSAMKTRFMAPTALIVEVYKAEINGDVVSETWDSVAGFLRMAM